MDEEDPHAPEAFAIQSTTSLQERQTRTLKHGDTFGVFDQSGNILRLPGIADGLYHRDTRHLSLLDLTLEHRRPMLLSSTLRDDNAALTCDLTNPDIEAGNGGTALANGLVHLRRTRFLHDGVCHECVSVRNFDDHPQRRTVTISFAADFADLFEARGQRRQKRGTLAKPIVDPDNVTLAYTGLDDVRRTTQLRFEPAPTHLEAGRATYDLALASHEIVSIYLTIDCAPEGRVPFSAREAFLRAALDSRRALRASTSRAAATETSNEQFNEALRRSICDLYMLITDKPTGPYPYAGVPWFSTAFGRDALIAALHSLWLDPQIARGVLSFLAETQATAVDPAADAEPGKILHETRDGEMARLHEVPFGRYYGSVDSTPLFVMLAGAYVERTGDVDAARRLWPHVEAALAWIDKYGDRDGDGFVEYGRASGEGLVNQGWKDSWDSVSHADGTLAEGPIAIVEVQGYVYGARRAAATLANRLGLGDRAVALDQQAEALREAVEAKFWSDELGTYVLALDGRKRPCAVRASNAGHLLFTGLPSQEHAERVARTLLSGRFFTGWGIRTLASDEMRYNPMSYHNGSVWPHDNALIAMGFGRYGLRDEAARVFAGIFDAALYIEFRRLPELFCGFPRRRAQGPTFYPVACSPQAWAATTLPAMLAACLGLGFAPELGLVRFEHPALPAFLESVTLHNLSAGHGRITVTLQRTGRAVSMAVLRRSGGMHATMLS